MLKQLRLCCQRNGDSFNVRGSVPEAFPPTAVQQTAVWRERERERERDRQTDRQTDRQIDRERGRERGR